MSYLRPVENLLNSDAIKYQRPAGTSELYSAAGDIESILHLVAYQLRQLTAGLNQLEASMLNWIPSYTVWATMSGQMEPAARYRA